MDLTLEKGIHRCGDWFDNTTDPIVRLDTCGRELTLEDLPLRVVDRSRGGTHIMKYHICDACDPNAKAVYIGE